MKFAFAVCCLAAVVVFVTAAETKEEIEAKIAENSKICAEEFKISDETIKEFKDAADKTTLKASDDLKCYVKCVSEKINILVDNKANYDRVVEVHVAHGKDESKVRANVELCKGLHVDKYDCNASWAMFTCITKNL